MIPDTVLFQLSIHSSGVVACDGTACPSECPACNNNKENTP